MSKESKTVPKMCHLCLGSGVFDPNSPGMNENAEFVFGPKRPCPVCKGEKKNETKNT